MSSLESPIFQVTTGTALARLLETKATVQSQLRPVYGHLKTQMLKSGFDEAVVAKITVRNYRFGFITDDINALIKQLPSEYQHSVQRHVSKGIYIIKKSSPLFNYFKSSKTAKKLADGLNELSAVQSEFNVELDRLGLFDFELAKPTAEFDKIGDVYYVAPKARTTTIFDLNFKRADDKYFEEIN